jgi:protein ImuA
MLTQVHRHLQSLQKTAALESDPGVLPFGIASVDAILGGGLACGALHEIAARSKAHLAAATGFTLGLSSSHQQRGRGVLWIAEDMALNESGALCGSGLDQFGLAPERLLTIHAAGKRDVLWAMEEALRCRAVGAVIGELRNGDIGTVAVRRLSLAASASGALALLLRGVPATDSSTAATRWVVGAATSVARYGPGSPRFAVDLVRNRRGPLGSWTLEWSDIDERFVLAAHSQFMAMPALDRQRHAAIA